MTVILLFVLVLSFSISTAFAADTTTKSAKTLAAGSPKTTSFTSSQINTAAKKVKIFVEKNKRLPSYVTINKRQVTVSQFLKLAARNTVNLNSRKAKSVTLTRVKNPSNVRDHVKTGKLSKSQYVNLASKINQHYAKYGNVPGSLITSKGRLNFQNLVYTYSKILNYQATNKRLPNSVSVKPWKVVSRKATSEGSSMVGGLRPVYIMSDNISNKSIDNTRINTLVSALKGLGAKASNYSLGPNSPKALLDKNVPSNALVVYIWGGACAGTIKETGSSWYKKIKGSRKVFFVWTQGAKKITGLNWLERAHDDNFSPSSFKGLANPARYLLSNGYKYYEGYTSSKVNELAKIIFNQARG